MKSRFFIAFLLAALIMTSVSAAPNIKRPPVGGVSQNITLPELPITGNPMTPARMKEVLSYLGTGHTAALVAEKGFASLKAPIRRVAAPDLPTPAGFTLEAAYYIGKEDIKQAIREIVA